jgi:flagella basal body P-ring formation protein FlgA
MTRPFAPRFTALLALALANLTLPAALAQAPAAASDEATLQTTLLQARQMATQAATPGAPAGARIEVLPGALDPRLRLAPCALVQAYLPPGTRPTGRTRVGLRCVQGTTLWNVSLPVTVRVLAAGLVSTAALPAGTVLAAEHLQSAEIDWAADTHPAYTEPAPLLGRTLARPLAAGQALRSSDIKPRQWFAAGDTVRLVARGSGFSIDAEGQALSNGVEGQIARVRTEAGRVVSGQPIAERRMEVQL